MSDESEREALLLLARLNCEQARWDREKEEWTSASCGECSYCILRESMRPKE